MGIRDIKDVINKHKNEFGKNFEIYFHMDTDGVTSALAMKKYLEGYGMNLVDAHIIQYGTLEYAVRNKAIDSLAVIVDFANFKSMFKIGTDHHDAQRGSVTGTSHTKPSRCNVETISGEISNYDIFTNIDIELIQTVDSANYFKYNVTIDNVQNSLYKTHKDLSSKNNRFNLGLCTNRILLAYKNKRITVKSKDLKREHSNKNILECLVLDSNPSILSIYSNLKHYISSAISLEWSNMTFSHNTPKRLPTIEEIDINLKNYIMKSKIGSTGDCIYDEDYKIITQSDIGDVYDTGSYDRYVPFKNYPDSEILFNIFPMGLIQVSFNPFKEKYLKDINLGEISKEVISKFESKLSKINIPISSIKRESEIEIHKMLKKYGKYYRAIGFTYEDLKNTYDKSIIYQPYINRGDTKTIARLDLNIDSDITKDISLIMNKKYSEWKQPEIDYMSLFKIPVLDIIKSNSGGHASITNINALNYLSYRQDLINILFGTTDYNVVMDIIATEFKNNLIDKINIARSGNNINYVASNIELYQSCAAS